MGEHYQQIDSGNQLFTSHGTVLFVDTESGELRHAPLVVSPANVLVTSEGECALIRFVGPEAQQDMVFFSDYSAVLGSKRAQARETAISLIHCFSRVRANDKEFGLIAEGQFLCAEPDGRITLSRTECQSWERFHTRADIQVGSTSSWLSKRNKISGFVVSYNRASIIETCIRSLRFVDELIVVDKSSNDDTLEIARRYADKVVVVPWTPVVEDTREYALSLCSHDLIVYLDDDECLSRDAIGFILEECVYPSADIYSLPFHTYFLGRFDKRRRDWPEYHPRFFRRGALEFSAATHSSIMARSSNCRYIPADSSIFIHHINCASVTQWLEKINRYTSQPGRDSWFSENTPVSADLVRQQTDYWFQKGDFQDEYPAAYALLRVAYDIVDRVKRWEVEAGIKGEQEFATLCAKLQSEYDELEHLCGPRLGHPRTDDAGSAVFKGSPDE